MADSQDLLRLSDDYPALYEEHMALRAEVEGLREALRAIAEKPCIGTGNDCQLDRSDDPNEYCLVHLARSALAATLNRSSTNENAGV